MCRIIIIERGNSERKKKRNWTFSENKSDAYIWWLFQWSVSAGKESNESGVALRDRVPVLEVSISRNTSRMSGFREWRDLVRPRTVRFSAFTRCLTASACDLGRPAMLDFNSLVGSSRPCKNSINIHDHDCCMVVTFCIMKIHLKKKETKIIMNQQFSLPICFKTILNWNFLLSSSEHNMWLNALDTHYHRDGNGNSIWLNRLAQNLNLK